MAWEYRIIESLDYGHPGGSEPRYQTFAEQLNELSKEGWEIDQIAPSMMRGRISRGGGKDDSVSLTTIAICAIMKRKVE